jgi:hypothetical protein
MRNEYPQYTMYKGETYGRVAYARYLAKQKRRNRATFRATILATLFIAAVSAIALVGAIS